MRNNKDFELREACFVCTTPYQIMGAICISKDASLDSDLIVFGMFAEYDEVVSRLQSSGVFNEVIGISPDEYRNPGRGKAAIQMMRSKEIANSILPVNTAYKKYYSSSRAHIKNIILHELIKRNPDMEIVVYDDGMGTYDSKSHVLNTTSLRSLIERTLGWDLYKKEKLTFCVYSPDLFKRPTELNDCQISRMPRPNVVDGAMTIIEEVFGMNEAAGIEEQLIIFDPLRGLNTERDEKLKTIDICYEKAIEIFGRENVVIKPHPRSTELTSSGGKIYTHSSIPMEVIYSGMKDLSNRILITYASSAVYTPKILFGAEPIVINLFRITDGDSSEWEPQHKKFKNVYSDKDRIAAPKTIEEYVKLLKRLKGSSSDIPKHESHRRN